MYMYNVHVLVLKMNIMFITDNLGIFTVIVSESIII